MNPEIKQKWIAALKSGEYKRGEGVLKKKVDGKIQHCCLGVLCELYIKENSDSRWEQPRDEIFSFVPAGTFPSESVLTPNVKKWAGIAHSNGSFKADLEDGAKLVKMSIGSCLAEVNDCSKKDDFSDVIPYIEKYF